MKRRVAVKVLDRGLSGYPYRESTLTSAAAQLNKKRTIVQAKRGRLSQFESASMTAAFMKRLGSIHQVRFFLEGTTAERKLEELR